MGQVDPKNLDIVRYLFLAMFSYFVLHFELLDLSQDWKDSRDLFRDSDLDPIRDILTPKPFSIPFNGGPRICIGQQFALTEMGPWRQSIPESMGKACTNGWCRLYDCKDTSTLRESEQILAGRRSSIQVWCRFVAPERCSCWVLGAGN